jgi:hypothetical protein
MTITKQFVSAADFWWGMVEPDYLAQPRDVADLRAALHSAISLFHMSDWVFHTHERAVRNAFTWQRSDGTVLPVGSEENFATALEQQNQDFGRIRGVCHATKHLKLKNVRPVPDAPSHSANTRVRTTGFGTGGYGAGPYGGSERVMVESGGPSDIEFSDIARNVYEMWRTLNQRNQWWAAP